MRQENFSKIMEKEKSKKSGIFTKIKFVYFVYFAVALVASVQRYFLGKINNYKIFKTSFFNLIAGNDLYVLYPAAHFDHFKYSPTFALLMAPIAVLPDILGVVVWTLLNVVPLYYAINRLELADKKKALVCWIVLIELITSLQNFQSNGLIAALLVFAFGAFENKKNLWAALLIALAAYIKIFGIVAAVLVVFYPEKLKFMVYMVFWCSALFLLPLLIVPVPQLAFLYESWLQLLNADYAAASSLSVIGILKSWFDLDAPKIVVQLFGAALLAWPLLKFDLHKEKFFRQLFLSSLLMWIIIFNHKAESPTFVIALTGAALWYVNQELTAGNLSLLVLALVLTSLSPTDVFPKYLRDHWVAPYSLKALPCVLIWFRIEYQLLRAKRENDRAPYGTSNLAPQF
jgi:hypothetical protein